MTLTVRHRVSNGNLPSPPFSARNFRDLSGGAAAGDVPPPGFAETAIPVFGATLAQCIYLSGLFASPALCSGLGRCGLCRVRFLSAPPPALEAEKTILSPHDLDAGWRLACRHAPEEGMRVLVPALPVAATRGSRHEAAEASGPRTGRFALAVDLGTTSIHWRVVPLAPPVSPGSSVFAGETATDPVPPHGIMTNPQMGAGSDVISRIAYAAREEGREILGRLVADALAATVDAVRAEGFPVEALCVAANPAMTGIFLGCDIRSLAHAPYALPCSGNREAAVAGLPPAYIPPLIAPFVGGDVSAGYAALALNPDGQAPPFPFLLADLGTNGECVLALSPDEALAASLPMGPALEGVNLAFGSAAVPGAVTEYTLTPYGLAPVVMGGGSATGITATGYLSLLRLLRAAGIISEDGLFLSGSVGVCRDTASDLVFSSGHGRKKSSVALDARMDSNTRPTGTSPSGRTCVVKNESSLSDDTLRRSPKNEEKSIRLPDRMALFASDVEAILKVKACFTLAVSRLLREASLPATRLSRIYLAGSLGMNVPIPALTGLGFVPAVAGKAVVPGGNTSLAGAALFCGDTAVREACARWAERVVTLDLAADPAFGEDFARHMVFAWRT